MELQADLGERTTTFDMMTLTNDQEPSGEWTSRRDVPLRPRDPEGDEEFQEPHAYLRVPDEENETDIRIMVPAGMKKDMHFMRYIDVADEIPASSVTEDELQGAFDTTWVNR